MTAGRNEIVDNLTGPRRSILAFWNCPSDHNRVPGEQPATIHFDEFVEIVAASRVLGAPFLVEIGHQHVGA